jgi:hypothetical protein
MNHRGPFAAVLPVRSGTIPAAEPRIYLCYMRAAVLRLPPNSQLTCGVLAIQLTPPLAGREGDLHPQVSAPCRADQKDPST